MALDYKGWKITRERTPGGYKDLWYGDSEAAEFCCNSLAELKRYINRVIAK